MTKAMHRVVAWIGILGIAFAQFAVTAHACAHGAAPRTGHAPAVIAADAAVVTSHCGDQDAGRAAPAPNLCEVHCTDAATPTPALDLPAAALAPLPVAAITLADLAATATPQPSHLAAPGRAPPLILQFGRLLI